MTASLAAAGLIFCLRCIDVSLGTLRMILTIQGRRSVAALLGFVEVSVFITAVASVVRGPLDPFRIVGYGLGFAAGTFIGMTIDRRLGLGNAIVRVITAKHHELVARVTGSGFGATLLEGTGGLGTPVGLVFTIARRNRVAELLGLIRATDAGAIATVQEIRAQHAGYFAPKRPAAAPGTP